MRAVGIILAGGNSYRMRDLSNKRAIAAMPIAGSYRSIDFALSSMALSRVQKVAVLTQYNSRSLNEHLNSSKWWDFGRKQGGLFVFPPMQTPDNSFWYRGTADALHQNLDWLKRCHEPYVILAAGDGVYKLDFEEILTFHIAKKADVTVVCREIPEDDDATRFGVIQMDENGRIVRFDEKPMAASSNIISCGIYVVRRRLLIELIEQAGAEGRFDFVRDILIRYKDVRALYGCKINTYWSNIASVESWYKTNMDFLKPEVRSFFFREYPCIRSKPDDLPPAKYNPGCEVRDSLVSSGSIINGYVNHSVICKNVFVGENCRISGSVILRGAYIGDNVTLENCIVESSSTIRPGTRCRGEGSIRIVIEPDEHYMM